MVCSLSFRRQARVCMRLAEDCDDRCLAKAEILEELPGERAKFQDYSGFKRLADKRASVH